MYVYGSSNQFLINVNKENKTTMTDSEILRVVEAHIEGQKIQCNYKKRAGIDWWDVKCPNWDFSEYDFRVAPEPRTPRQWRLLVDRANNGVYGMANDWNSSSQKTETVLVREVIE